MAWTPDERETIVARFHEASKEITNAQFDVNQLSGAARAVVSQDIARLSDELVALVQKYKQGLPSFSLSRSPFTGDAMIHSFDPVDLRGMWWRGENPARPQIEPAAGATFVALTGAIRLIEPVEYTKFVAHPGPGAPFVLPALLRMPTVKATVSSLAIGKHTGFAIAYFSTKEIPFAARPTIWGTEVSDLDWNYRWDDYTSDDDRVWDFQLEPWIDSGKLSWIAPGDPEMRLQNGRGGCPYLNIAGTRKLQYVSVGTVRTLSML